MPYPKTLLNDYETVALDLHPHWWFYTKALLGVAASIIFAIVVKIVTDGTLETTLLWLAIAGIAASVVWLVGRYAVWSTTNFVVTSDRVIYRSGVIRKSGIEIPLERVNNVSSRQGVFERMLGAGDLLIESGGESGQQRFTDIKNPARVQNLIHAQREANNTRMFGGGNRGAPAGGDVASQLEKLEGMLERGTLTQAEFDAQKQRLLEG
jgi:uncharacterized membrane protein YdbT with pleckstrin-like domain